MNNHAQLSEKGLMQQGNIFLQVLLLLLQDPLLEVQEVESVWVVYPFPLQPVHEVREVLRDLVPYEYPVYHVTTKQTHLYLVTQVRLDAFVLVDCLEYVRCG